MTTQQLEALGYRIEGGRAVPTKSGAPARTGGRKYRNVPTRYRGVRYDSKAEAARAEELNHMLQSGEILAWERQPGFRLGVDEVRYVADFRVVNTDGSVHIEDVKGVRTPKFNLVARLWRRFGPHPLHILSRKGRKWSVEVVDGIGG